MAKRNPNLTKNGNPRLGTMSIESLNKLAENCKKSLKNKIVNRLKLISK